MKKQLVCLLLLLFCGIASCCAEAPEREIDWSRPVVGLTFDDGPSQYTMDILQLLEENDCRATFFMLGNRMGQHAETVQAVARSGNEIGTHTWAHEVLSELEIGLVRKTLSESAQKIQAMTGRTVRFLRPPYGAVDDEVYMACRLENLIIVTWSLDSHDWEAESAQQICDTILQQVKNGDIILCHDTLRNTVKAMETVLPALVERGYQVVSVGELFSNYAEELRLNANYHHLNLDKVKK